MYSGASPEINILGDWGFGGFTFILGVAYFYALRLL